MKLVTIKKASESRVRNMTLVGMAVAVLLVLGSCYWNPHSGAGKLTLNMQSISRNQVSSSANYGRVYVYDDNMNSRLNIGDGTPYVEVPISGNSVTVDHVPAGTGYKLVVTFGAKQDGVFIPQQYVWTDGDTTFDVTAGHQTTVSLTGNVTSVANTLVAAGLTGATTTPALIGKNLRSVATANFQLAAASANTAYFGYTGSATYTAVSPGVNINSVSPADFSSLGPNYVTEFLLNTSEGIREYDYSGNTPSPLTLPSGGPTGNVYSSVVYYNGQSQEYTVYYSGSRSLGGVLCTGQTAQLSGQWVDAGFPTNQDHPVWDSTLAFDGSSLFSYFTTAIGAFGIASNLFLTPLGANFTYIHNSGAFFTLSGRRILSVTSDGIGSLYLGTDSGVYGGSNSSIDTKAIVLTDGGQGATLPFAGTLLNGTDGHPFHKVIYGSFGNGYLLAALSNNLLVLTTGTASITLPLAALSLGDVNDIAMDSGANYILVAGTEGLMYVVLQSLG